MNEQDQAALIAVTRTFKVTDIGFYRAPSWLISNLFQLAWPYVELEFKDRIVRACPGDTVTATWHLVGVEAEDK